MKIRGAYRTSINAALLGATVVVGIEVHQETIDAAFGGVGNLFENREINLPITIRSSSNLDKAGLHPRGVFVRWLGNPPDGYKDGVSHFIPVFREFNWQRRWMMHETGIYLGEPAIIVGKRPEIIRY